jgi:D-sedoheptulose 7-phosphate isomerase
MKEQIKKLISENVSCNEKLLDNGHLVLIEEIANLIIDTYACGKKVLTMGNGGSASDAQHFAAELVCRFEKNRGALPAIALPANTSSITAIGNDYSFEDIFSRQLEGFANEGDLVIGISTSGNSPNILKGIDVAAERKARTVGLTGHHGGKLKGKVDKCFCAPSAVTARIQECHVLVIHILCKLVEEALFAEK